jgi:hypothetical protein
MSDTDLAWATGYIEADGTFGFHTGNNGSTYRAIVSSYSTDLEPLSKLCSLFGGKVAVQRKRGDKNDRIKRFIDGMFMG